MKNLVQLIRGENMDSYTIIVLIFGILILFILFILFFINRLMSYNNMVKCRFSNALEYLEIRLVIIEDMISFVSKNLEHETSYVKKLQQTKDSIQKLFQDNSNLKEFKKYEKNFLHFTTLDETYSFLKKNQDYLDLKEEITLNQDRVIYAMESYDRGVMSYNDYLEKKWIGRIAKIFRFPNYDYYN